MEALKKRFRTVVLLLAVSAALTTVFQLSISNSTKPANLEQIPLLVGDFVGAEIPVTQSVKDILETPNVLMREYRSLDGTVILVAIVYYEQYRVYFHMPEGCMVGQGSVIVASETENVSPASASFPLKANKLVLKQEGANEYVYYYFVSDGLITPRYPLMRLHLMLQHLKRRQSGAALVRFSTHASPANAEERTARLKDFIRQISPLLPEYLS